MSDLRVAYCSPRAARFAVEHWHYSQTMPVGKLVTVGAWEHGEFVGAFVFGRGATPRLSTSYDLDQTEMCELVRVAFRRHARPLTEALAGAVRLVRHAAPGLRLIVSFADGGQGHHGGLYQAASWIYLGSVVTHALRVNGSVVHPRSLHARYGVGGQAIGWLRAHVDANADRVFGPPKHRYVLPLDRPMRRKLAPHAQPYPKSDL